MQEAIRDTRQGDDTEIPEGAALAAIDLGSNSFHLIIARVEHDEVRSIETLSEKVQLGAGLRNNKLDDAAIQRGLDCLSRFKQVLDAVSPYRTRIVGQRFEPLHRESLQLGCVSFTRKRYLRAYDAARVEVSLIR